MQMQKNIQRVITDRCCSWRAIHAHTWLFEEEGIARPRASVMAMSGSSRHDTYQPMRRGHVSTAQLIAMPPWARNLHSHVMASLLPATALTWLPCVWCPTPTYDAPYLPLQVSQKQGIKLSCEKTGNSMPPVLSWEPWMSPSQPQISDSQSALFGKSMM